MQSLTITRPDDWHVHLRDGDVLPQTVKDMARYFQRCIVMPNLVPPVTTAEHAQAYLQRIEAAKPENLDHPFIPLMTLYLTDNTSPEIVRDAKASGIVYAFKLYPAGATTNSDSGVTDLKNIYPAIEVMQELGMPLLCHGEVTSAGIDIFDREKEFVEGQLPQLVSDFPNLKVVLEHITTKEAADFVIAASDNVAATVTPQHLLFNRNDMLVGGIRPHYYCLPILKRNIHQEALNKAVTSGSKKFFLGTDSAPHATHTKESACGCAGCYSAFAAIELYAQAFEENNALDKLEAFASHNGPDFYGLPRNTDTITLQKSDWQAPISITFGKNSVTPLQGGETLAWQVAS